MGPSNIAGLEVQLPTRDAEVWLQGHKQSGSGTTRRFYSPPLEPGKNYTYTINAAWYENGELVTQKRQVDVRADALARVDFTQSREMAERDMEPRARTAPPRDEPLPRAGERTAAKPEIDAPPPVREPRADLERSRKTKDLPPRDKVAPPPAEPSDKAADRDEGKAPPIDAPKSDAAESAPK